MDTANSKRSFVDCTAGQVSAARAMHSLRDCTGIAVAGLGKPAAWETGGSPPGMSEPALRMRTASDTDAARKLLVHPAAAHIVHSGRSSSVAVGEAAEAVGDRIGPGCCNYTTFCPICRLITTLDVRYCAPGGWW